MRTDITYIRVSSICVRLYRLELISVKNKLTTRTRVEEDLIVKLRVIVPEIDNEQTQVSQRKCPFFRNLIYVLNVKIFVLQDICFK